ncbi:MAG: D-2-hydroxyacid dehydrogenase [Clostridiales bacterium]|nr:D-2-hydroxyacid dehydrogenase [Clostridiales bacterium]
MNIRNVLVIMRGEESHLEKLRQAAPEAEVIRQSVKTLTDEQIEAADVIVGNLPPERLPKMKKARLLQLNTAGVAAPYLALGQTAPDTVLCCASGAYGPAISEHMLAVLLMLMKRLHQYRDDQHQAAWVDHGTVRGLQHARVLVVGLGDIGQSFARLVSLMGARVAGIRRRAGTPPEGVEQVATMEALDRLLPQADVVALSLPETKETIGLMDVRRLGLMKQNSYLINVGRGSAVDQEALLAALQSGHLAGAGLDVTVPEPLPPDHPLWQQQNLVLTPHISGQYHMQITHDRIIDIAAHNIRALREGGQFIARVDYASGYRA